MQRASAVVVKATTGDSDNDLRIQLLAFLELYKTKVDQDASTTSGRLKVNAQAAASFFFSAVANSKTKPEVLDGIFTRVQSEIALCNTKMQADVHPIQNWLKLVRTLRECAIKAQEQKTSDGVSRLAENLDALASMVICHIDQNDWYKQRVNNLLDEYKSINQPITGKIAKDHEERQGKGVEDFNARSRDILADLSSECHPYALSVLRQHSANEQATKNLPTTTTIQKYREKTASNNWEQITINFAVPLPLQRCYARYLFEEQYRSMPTVLESYDSFLNNAIVKHLAKTPGQQPASAVNAAPVATNNQSLLINSGASQSVVPAIAPINVLTGMAESSATPRQVSSPSLFAAEGVEAGNLGNILRDDYQAPDSPGNLSP